MSRLLVSIKALVPANLKQRIRSLIARIKHFGWRRRCNICGSWLSGFVAHGIPAEPDFLCPVCRSKPPHRLAMHYFANHPELFVANGLCVHIAPEPGLGRRLAQLARRAGTHYRSGSITGQHEQYLDLLSLPFADGSVAAMYCCHVLNSLQADRQAMREVCRVMHAQGIALLQVPAFHKGATTLETHSLEERLAVFGDAGISRCYTNDDYEQRLREAGFAVTAFRTNDLPQNLVRKFALKNEVLHICQPLVP